MSDETPNTPQPETETEPKAKAKAKPKADTPAEDVQSYCSALPEPTEFEVMGFRAERNANGTLTWRVPRELTERFERHIFFVNGKIKKA